MKCEEVCCFLCFPGFLLGQLHCGAFRLRFMSVDGGAVYQLISSVLRLLHSPNMRLTSASPQVMR